MKNKLLLISVLFLLVSLFFTQAKAQKIVHPAISKKPIGFAISKPLRDAPVVTGFENNEQEFYMNKYEDRKINPNIKPPDFNNMPIDPNVQTKQGTINGTKGLIHNYSGQTSGSYPPDCNGEAGPNYFFQVVNLTYAIYNKSTGAIVAGPSALNSIFDSGLPGAGYNDGDPIVLWDEHANRWFYSEFSVNHGNDYMLIAVSTTSDPTGTWYSWSYDVDDTPDYMKFGIWQDGYYMATNTKGKNDVYVFERSKMIAGDPNPQMISFSNPNRPSTFDGFHCIQPLDNDGDWAPTGTPGQFITVADDGQGNASDALYIYECHVDWNNTSNSTFSRTQTLNVNPFSGNFTSDWKNIPQPGTSQKLDAISTVLMYRAQYRNFNGTQKIVCAHTIAKTSTQGAIRWYELENTGSGWYIRQQSTYSPDGISRFVPSIAMNGSGAIAIGYSVSDGSSTYPGIRYCGQTPEAPLNTLDVAETTIYTGSYSQSSYERWGDYSGMSVDPTDDNTFWFTTEYKTSSSHGTRIASFSIQGASCTPPSSQASNFSVSSVGDNTATINWTRGNGDKVLVVAKQASAVNSDPVSGNSYTANSTFGSGSQLGTGNYVVYNGTGNSVSISNLNKGTEYFFAVYEYNTGDNCYNTTELTGNLTTTGVSYCASQGNSVNDEWMNQVVIGTINNTSGANGGYADFTSMSTDLPIGGSETVTLYPAWSGTVYDEGFAIWIDYNKDGDFEDSGELVYTHDKSQNTSVSGTINIPSSVEPGETVMRITMQYNTIPANPCGTYNYGETEDYTVNIVNGGDTQSPTTPSNLASSNVTSTTLDLSWSASTDNVGVTGYYIYKNGTSVGTVTGTSANITGLTADTQYNFYVKAYDAAGNKSNASNTIYVTTATSPDIQAPSAPSNLAYANVSQTSADLSWTSSTDNVGVTGYKIYKNNNYLETVTGTSYTANGLSASTTYEFYVKAEDAAGNISDKSNTVSFTTQSGGISYCNSKGNTVSDEWLNRVVCEDIDKTSGANNGYADFTFISTTLYKDNTANITLYPEWSGTVYSEGYSVWIDYNRDGDFDDSGEQIYTHAATKDASVSGSFTVPASATTGPTRMRVSMKYNGIPSACETFDYGEVEDYTINIQNGGDMTAPSTPTNLTGSNITQTSVDLSWTASTDNVGVTGYKIYKNNNYVETVAGTTYTASGLSSSTTYEFYVKAEDAAGNLSNASNIINITTANTPDTQAPTAPDNLAASNISSASLILTWNASTDNVGVTEYNVYKDGSNIGSTANTNYTVSGLAPSTSYSFFVKAKDAAGNVSGASNTVNATTSAGSSYCSSQGNTVSDEWINQVVCGTINHTSGANNGYADFTSMSTNMALSSGQTITIYPAWSGTVYSEGYSVWIDYNQDGDFEDSGEQVFSKAASKDATITGTFSIPASAITGTTRMRVSMKYNGIPTPCETFDYGEVEDYTVNITSSGGDTQSPTAPSNLSYSNVTETTVDLSWDASSDDIGVDKYYVYQNTVLLGSVSGTSAQVTGLTAGTSYNFYVTAKDAAGNESGASNTVNVTTASASISYCESKGNTVTDEWIKRVVCGSIDHTSANEGYSDFTSYSTNMSNNSSYNITIYPAWSGTVYSEAYRVWIDYNQDGDFTDAGEQVFTHAKTTATSVSGSFTVPSSALSGSTRMRVSMRYNTEPDPCGNFDYGEVEDYTVNINAKSAKKLAKSLYIYPNPANNFITFYLKGLNKKTNIKIYSITGSLVKEIQISDSYSKINISDLPAGVYNIRMIYEGEVFNGKFIKQ